MLVVLTLNQHWQQMKLELIDSKANRNKVTIVQDAGLFSIRRILRNTSFNLLTPQMSMVLSSFIGLDLVGKMYALKMSKVFALNDFGALLSFEVPSVKVLDRNELG